MKPNIKLFHLLIPILLSAIISGCSSGKKASGTNTGYGKAEQVYLDNSGIRDPNTGILWSYYEDNPTTYYRFKLDESGSLSRLPNADQLLDLLLKVSGQLAEKKDPGNIRTLFWFDTDCDFLTSRSMKTDEGEVLYEVIRWNSRLRTSEISSVTGGDLVVILFVN